MVTHGECQADRLKQTIKIKVNLSNDQKGPFYAIIDNFLYKTSLKSSTDVDFERKIWIKYFLKDNSSFYSSSSALSDRSIQVEDNTKRPFRLTKRWLRPLRKGDRLTEVKITGKQICWLLNTEPHNAGLTVILNRASQHFYLCGFKNKQRDCQWLCCGKKDTETTSNTTCKWLINW